ncbi:MAG: hypothetical protein H7835_06410 [Magnetococcus sp. XQGC-1]
MKQDEQGNLTLLAILVLVGLSVLGASMGWMQVRGIDIAAEWLNRPLYARQSLAALVEFGKRVAQDQFSAECTLPAAADFRLEIPAWGTVSGLFSPPTTEGIFPLTITASQGNQSQQRSCRALCAPRYAGLPAEQGGNFAIRIACP